MAISACIDLSYLHKLWCAFAKLRDAFLGWVEAKGFSRPITYQLPCALNAGEVEEFLKSRSS
jgi:hypothetical protein